MAAADPTIKKIKLKNGKVRYRFVIDIGKKKEDGKRNQLTVTRDTLTEAKNERARIIHEQARGTFVAPNKMTVDELLDAWLESATRGLEEGTRSNYTSAVLPVRTRLGHKQIQQLTESDVEKFVDWMISSGRRRGGKPGTGLSVRAVELTLGRLRSALTFARRRFWVVSNVAQYVVITREARQQAAALTRDDPPWDETEVRTFIGAIEHRRLYGAMMLTLIAERPAEVCGVRWEHVDLAAGTVKVARTRTIVYDRALARGERNKVVEKEPKSRAGSRTLPLPSPVVQGLKTFRAIQAREKLAAGEAYNASGYVLVDELGNPMKTDMLRRRAYRFMELAGVRRVRLYLARHAILSWMANNGVPDTVVSAWAGHTDLGFTKRTYVHPDPQSLKAGSDKLTELLSLERPETGM
ncbi:site-specific integrase [Embleya scabrispora]|uniref:Site-specific integrase n=1 Tax=Embleya scabrispora TaxID=159449 RepID=A0A1T3P5A5_9ACTN|nr:tyrosine-type recombinase/integrase [Embleya scabrispora]OPC84268.1 site-specific integrase [Embleya scabrispora]